MLALTGLEERANDPVDDALRRQPPAGQRRDRPAVRPAGAAARRAVRRARPAPARALLGGRRPPAGGAPRGRVHDARRRRGRAPQRPACSCSPTARSCSPARRPSSSRSPAPRPAPTSRPPSSASSRRAATDVPAASARTCGSSGARALLVVTLILYPAARRAADRPRAVARAREAEDRGRRPDPARRAGHDARRQGRRPGRGRRRSSRRTSTPSASPTRAEAAKLVEDGDVLAAIILPDDINDRLSATINLFGGTPPEIEVLVNGSDPVKARYVESVVDARARRRQPDAVDDAHEGRRELRDEARQGRRVHLRADHRRHPRARRRASSGSTTALRRAAARLAGERARLAERRPSSPASPSTTSTARRSGIVSAVSQPLVVKTTRVDGRDTPLETFAVATAAIVSLMLVSLMLGAALLALERTENTYARLVRGLVRPEELVGSKLLLAGGLGAVVAFVLLGIVSLFVDARLGRRPTLGARARARRRSRSRRSASRSPCSRATWRPRRCSRSRSRCRSRSSRSSRRTRSAPGSTTSSRVDLGRVPVQARARRAAATPSTASRSTGPALHLARARPLVYAALRGAAGPAAPAGVPDRPRRTRPYAAHGLPRHTPAPPAPHAACSATSSARPRVTAARPRPAAVRRRRASTSREPVEAMPGVERLSLAQLVDEAGEAARARHPGGAALRHPGRQGRGGLAAPGTTRASSSWRPARSRTRIRTCS